MRFSGVTTIIPVFNRESFLDEAVDSVFAQTHRPIEIIIVDDGSSDATPELARKIAEKSPDTVRYIRQENSGPGIARNTGLKYARGEFIQYLDSDDLLAPLKFELQVQALRNHPQADLAYCISQRKNMITGETRIWARTAERIEKIFPEFLMQRGWDTNCPLWRRSVCEAIGPWGDFRCMEDWEHDLRAGMLGVHPVHVAEPLVMVRDHQYNRASGMNSGFTPALTGEFFRAHRSIWLKMREAGLTDWDYLEAFSRKMFWIARMCGERGLTVEANEAVEFAEDMVATHQSPRDIQLFRAMARLMGWPSAVAISEGARRLLRRARGQTVA